MMSTRFHLIRDTLRSVLLGAMISLLSPSGFAVPRKKQGIQGAPVAVAAKMAYLRIWKADFASKKTVRVNFRISGRKSTNTSLTGQLSGYSFADYLLLPATSGSLEIYDVAEPSLKLAAVEVRVAQGSYSTLILRESSSAVLAELVDDRSPGGKIGELTVRSFVPDLGAIQVEAGSDLQVRLAGSDSFIHLRGLPPTKVKVRASTLTGGGRVLRWSSEVDFSQAPRWTVLIYADPYGRIRSRVAIDGSGAF